MPLPICWYARIVERDWFGASRRDEVATWIEQCQELHTAFEQEVYRRSSDDAPDGASRDIPGVLGLPVIGPVPPLKVRRTEKEKEMGA